MVEQSKKEPEEKDDDMVPAALRENVYFKSIEVKDGDKWIKLSPFNGFKIDITTDFDHPDLARWSAIARKPNMIPTSPLLFLFLAKDVLYNYKSRKFVRSNKYFFIQNFFNSLL